MEIGKHYKPMIFPTEKAVKYFSEPLKVIIDVSGCNSCTGF